MNSYYMVNVSFQIWMPEQDKKALQAEAERLGVSASDIARLKLKQPLNDALRQAMQRAV